MLLSRFAIAGVVAGGAIVASCGLGDFDAVSKLKTVRMLATRIDHPYAKPGDTVTFETLAYDARPDKTRPMTIYWLPFSCIDPKDDLYYLCFQQLAAAGDGGAPDGGAPGPGALLKPGVDLTPFLPSGLRYTTTLPPTIIDRHPVVPGAIDRYGLAIVFNVACAGHLEIVPPDPSDIRKQQVPLGCFDESHTRLEASDYVIGIQRVYAYADRTNANPVIDHVVYQGQTLDTTQGITVATCGASHRVDCPDLKLDVFVPDDSWETNPGDTDTNGNTRHEQLWVDWYSDIGDFQGDARLLFDPAQGRVSDSETKLHAPSTPGDGIVFAVVHDNRGGVAWTSFPVHVR